MGLSKFYGTASYRKFYPSIIFLFILSTLYPALVFATVPTGFQETLVDNGLNNATAMALAPDGRIFVCEQGGALRIIKNGQLLSTPFLSVTVSSSGERGLIGVAIDPNFASNQYVYVYYTATTPAIHNRVSRFTANGDVAVGGSEFVILNLNDLSSATNHNGGGIHFGSDGKLYIAAGDNANGNNSQVLTNLLGKLSRMNTDGTIPTDNPFYNTATGDNRAIWALGLRNPFTFDVQPGTGRIFINDVGQSTWEEINDGLAGANYGWPGTEGAPMINTGPLFRYGHGSGNTLGCAITGGTFYNPQVNQFPADYVGKYFFADYCNGWIRRYDPVADVAIDFASNIASPVDVKVGSDGTLYYLARGADGVYKVTYSGNQAPTITQDPVDVTVPVGVPATFTVSASGTNPLTYQWQRDNADIPGATATSYTLTNPLLTDSGAHFRCVVSNPYGTATSNSATLTVVANQPPVATITLPTVGTHYNGGSTINYAGTGTDPEDGNLPASAFTWEVVFHHQQHTHPFILPFSGVTSGSFVLPVIGEFDPVQWYRIHLTVVDSGGLTNSVYRDILPNVVNVGLDTVPSGLQLKLDAQPISTPYNFDGVTGMIRNLDAPSPQTVGSITYDFLNWSDGGSQNHDLTTPSSNTNYQAHFNARPSTSITSPADGATFTAPANITINANASDPDGSITQVKFYSGTNLLSTDTTSPYSYTWNNVGVGVYTLTVQATDNNSTTTTSSPVHISVNPAGNVPPATNITQPQNGDVFNAPATIGIDANATDSDGTIAKVDFYSGSTLLGTDTTSPYHYDWSNVQAGPYTLTTRATDNQGAVTTSSAVNINVNGGGTLPAPWQGHDIGGVGLPGSSSFASGMFTVNASGHDIWANSDGFYFVSQLLSGNGEVTAFVSGVENTNGWAKAGVMIRETLASGSKHAMMAITPANGASFLRRTSTGGNSNSTTQSGLLPPYWVKVARNGNTFTGSVSTDGSSWTQVGSVDITMATEVQAGLALSSHDDSTLNTSFFQNVSVAGGGSSTFSDDFEDGDISDWTYTKGSWSVVSGNLTGVYEKKANIFPTTFGGCRTCTVEADLEIQSTGKVSLLGWYQDKQNMVELRMDEGKDKWILKVRSGGVVTKFKVNQTIDPSVNYHAKVVYDGTQFSVYIDGNLILTTPANASSGIVGFRVNAATGSFKEIQAY